MYSEEELDAARQRDGKMAFRVFLFAPPVIPAAFGPFYSDSLNYSPRLDTGILQDFENLFGDVLYPYLFIAAYLIATIAFIASCSWPKGYWQILFLYWLSWGWFYYCVMGMDNPAFAFGGLLAVTGTLLVVIFVPLCMWTVIKNRQ